MVIKILGSGCPNCIQLEKNVERAIEELDINATIEKVTDIKDIVSYGVMNTPALVVDNEVKLSGRVPSVKELKNFL